MAELINLKENEYETIVSELSNMHTNQLQNVSVIITEMRTLVTSNDVFSAELTSKKIEDMLDTLSTDVISLLEQVFEDSELSISNMITGIKAIDTIYS